MPIQPCTCSDGKKGRRWGQHGKCYCGKGAATKAGHQAAAAYAHGYAGEEEEDADDERSKEIAHLIRKGYPKKRAAAAAYSMYGEDKEEDDGGASAASPRMDRKTVMRLLELCRENRLRGG